MDHETRSRLKPADGSAAEAIESVARMRAYRDERAEARSALAARRPDVLVSGSNDDVDRLEASISEVERDVETADLMIAAIEPTIEEKRKAERRAELADWRERLRPRVAAADEWANAAYESLVPQALLDGLDSERRLMAEVRAYNHVVTSERYSGSLLDNESVPANIGLTYDLRPGRILLSEAVKLPGLGELPLWPTRMEPIANLPAPCRRRFPAGRDIMAERVLLPPSPSPSPLEDEGSSK